MTYCKKDGGVCPNGIRKVACRSKSGCGCGSRTDEMESECTVTMRQKSTLRIRVLLKQGLTFVRAVSGQFMWPYHSRGHGRAFGCHMQYKHGRRKKRREQCSYDSACIRGNTRPKIRLVRSGEDQYTEGQKKGSERTHSFATGPVMAEPFISPLGFTMTPALSYHR